VSLWQVDDDATRRMMVAYYRQLAAGAGRAEALRQVRLDMLAHGEHPYFWASFIVSGSPQALDGHAVVPSFTPVRGPRGCACQTGGGGGSPIMFVVLVAAGWLRRRTRRR
jgi:MYXO-CTERM domain-containing protein